jgi:hypothetical protein
VPTASVEASLVQSKDGFVFGGDDACVEGEDAMSDEQRLVLG